MTNQIENWSIEEPSDFDPDESQISEEVLQKQTYLRQEIIEKGYDPDEFIEWLESHKAKGCEIIDLGFSDLIEIVEEYHRVKKITDNPILPNSSLASSGASASLNSTSIPVN